MLSALLMTLGLHIFILRAVPRWRPAGEFTPGRTPAGITVHLSAAPSIAGPRRSISVSDSVVNKRRVASRRQRKISANSALNAGAEHSPVVIKPRGVIEKKVLKNRQVRMAGEMPRQERRRAEKSSVPPDLPAGKNLDAKVTAAPGGGAGKPRQDVEAARRHDGGGRPVIQTAMPLYKENQLPVYPGLARKRGYEGTTVLRVLVNEKGMVGKVRVATSSGHGILDKAAVAAVKRWSFAPGVNNGLPIAMWVMVPVHFSLSRTP